MWGYGVTVESTESGCWNYGGIYGFKVALSLFCRTIREKPTRLKFFVIPGSMIDRRVDRQLPISWTIKEGYIIGEGREQLNRSNFP